MMIFVHKTGAQHAMLQAMSRGYHWYVSGEVAADRLGGLREKFASFYGIDIPHRTKVRRRERGQANASFFAHPTYTRPTFGWWLLLTDGDHPARAQERDLRDAREKRQRLRFHENYEALTLPAPGAKPRWTWRLTADFDQHLRSTITEAIRHRKDDRAIKDVIRTCHSLPGFRGIRHQVAALRRHIAAEWKRTKDQDECPHLPVRMPPYTRFQTYRSVPHEVIRDRIMQGLTPFSLEMRYGEASPEVISGDT